MASKNKEDNAAQLVSVLQNVNESIEVRCAVCDAVLALTKQESSCSTLCGVGGVHAVINTLKNAGDCPALVKGAVQILCNLYRFDSKLMSVVVRLQDGISALLDVLRAHIQCVDIELLRATLSTLSDVSSNATNVALIVKHNGTSIVLACVLAHLKLEELLLPALQVLVNTSRSVLNVPILSREGVIPAILAIILAHMRNVEILRLALMVLRHVVADAASAIRMSGQGAYRIIFAVLQAHCTPENLELVRIGSTVMWRIYQAKCPPTALLHAHLVFKHAKDDTSAPVEEERIEPRAGDNSSSSDDDGIITPRPAANGTNESTSKEIDELTLAVRGDAHGLASPPLQHCIRWSLPSSLAKHSARYQTLSSRLLATVPLSISFLRRRSQQSMRHVSI